MSRKSYQILKKQTNIPESLIYMGIFFLVLGVYLFTIAPSVTSEDSGELISAAYSMGISHPPGYPLWTSLGKMFCFLPMGSVPFRCNFFSALFASLTILIIYRIIFRLTREKSISVSCALLFAFSPMMWSQSVITEVYSLHAFLYSLIIDRFLLWIDNKKSEDFIFFGFIFGLAVSNHHLILTLVPAVVIAMLMVQPEIFKKRDVVLPTIIFFLLGLSLYVYLPIRSLKNPAVDWGNPENLENFLDHVLRRQYGISKTHTPFTLEQFFARLEIVILWLKEQFSVFLLITGIIGVYFTLIKDKIKGIFLTIAYLMGSLGLTLALNFRLEKEQLSDVSVFFLTSYIPFILLISLGFAGIHKYFEHNKYAKTLWKVFLFLIPLWFLFQNLPTENESRNYLSLDYARNILQKTEPGGILDFFPNS